MIHDEIRERLNDYVDNDVAFQEKQEIEAHVKTCTDCTKALEQLRNLLSHATSLSRDIQPSRDLWKGVSERLEPQNPKIIPLPSSPLLVRKSSKPSLSTWVRIAAAVVIAFGSFWLITERPGGAWEVAAIEGRPKIEEENIGQTGRLQVGQWLETNEASRARLTIADIGHAEIGPNSRIRLLVTQESEQRLQMTRGRMTASVSSPPRIFIVETPSATAVDLGCSYDLFVNESGNGTIHVTSGEVSMEFKGRNSFVPTGAMCETKRGIGPGTPYSDLSSDIVRQSLREFDFGNGGIKTLHVILQNATNLDAITLWHLLQRVDETQRGPVFDRFAALIPPPKGVTKEGIMSLDGNMLEEWLNEFAVRSFSLKRLLSSR